MKIKRGLAYLILCHTLISLLFGFFLFLAILFIPAAVDESSRIAAIVLLCVNAVLLLITQIIALLMYCRGERYPLQIQNGYIEATPSPLKPNKHLRFATNAVDRWLVVSRFPFYKGIYFSLNDGRTILVEMVAFDENKESGRLNKLCGKQENDFPL